MKKDNIMSAVNNELGENVWRRGKGKHYHVYGAGCIGEFFK
jgi:hypothetical protein